MALLLEDRRSIETMTKQEARGLIEAVPLFHGLNIWDIDELAGDCKAILLAPGETLVRSGDPSESVFVVVDGELEVLRHTGNDLIPIGVRGAGEVVGEMALLTNAPRNATLRARGETRVLEIEQRNFANWLERHPGAAMKVLGTIVRRLQSAEGHLVQHQHLAALGTLAAGLAHELNNPASALVRSASRLGEAVTDWSALSWDLGGQGNRSQTHDALMSRMSKTRCRADEPRNPLEASDRESDVAAWLRDHDVPEPWRLAPVLVENGWDSDALANIADETAPEQLASTVRWLASGGTVVRLLDELKMSAQVISELVAAVKSYSRLDEAPVQSVDIHAGIDQSLTILRHKLRGATVIREYAEHVPH
ncbi:MAG TPA: cyclic nucleotide-binding domain-containing protein, partial [Thermomicrobiales bacterium]|nr:cyclic nucleotide-binding domain-containing protein [Thermomicrobiales bacterium]